MRCPEPRCSRRGADRPDSVGLDEIKEDTQEQNKEKNNEEPPKEYMHLDEVKDIDVSMIALQEPIDEGSPGDVNVVNDDSKEESINANEFKESSGEEHQIENIQRESSNDGTDENALQEPIREDKQENESFQKQSLLNSPSQEVLSELSIHKYITKIEALQERIRGEIENFKGASKDETSENEASQENSIQEDISKEEVKE